MKIMTTKDCALLHKVLEPLPVIRYPFELETLPMNGIYFFYEEGETNAHDGTPGIVRVGTHKRDNFRSRINDHYLLDGMDFDKNSPAPKDRSIFRKNIGRALLNKMNSDYISIWDIDFTLKTNRQRYGRKRDINLEIQIEKEITRILKKKFSFRYIQIDSQKQRMGKQGLESRLIGTLSHCKLCEPSKNWLGRSSPKKQIRDSGLWLIQHLNSEGLDSDDKNLIGRLIRSSIRA